MDPHPLPPPAPFAAFLEEVRTTENNDQFSSDFEDILAELPPQELHHRRDEYLHQYVQALAANQYLGCLYFDFKRFTDICFLKHLHSHATLRSLRLPFEPRDEDDYHYQDLDDEIQDVEIERTIANFVCLKNLYIWVQRATGAPRFAQAFLRGISHNPSLRGLFLSDLDDYGLQELDWNKSRLQKLEIDRCDLSFSTWKSLLTIPSLESLELSTLSGGDRAAEPAGRIPRHVISRNHIFRSLPVQCRTIRNLIINWQETDIRDLENMIRFFEFEKLTINVMGLLLREDEPPTPEEFQENFSRICGLVNPANSKLYFVFDRRTTTDILSDFPELLRTMLGFPAVVGMTRCNFIHDDFDNEWHSSQCLCVLTEHGEHLERLDISGIGLGDDEEICKMIANLPGLKYLTAYTYPTLSIAEAVDAHSNLLKFNFHQTYGEGGKKLADRARYRIETSLRRNRANRFARRISSRTIRSEPGAGLTLWPTVLSNVDKGNIAALSGVFQAFRCDMGRLLVEGEMVQERQAPPSEKMAAGRKRRREKEADE